MSDKIRKTGYFRFPLALLSATEDPGELAQLIACHSVVERGWNQADRHGEAALAREPAPKQAAWRYFSVITEWMEEWKPEKIPGDFDPRDWRHCAALVATAPKRDFRADEPLGGLAMPVRIRSMRFTAEKYDEAEAHVRRHAEITGDRGPNVDAPGWMWSDFLDRKLSLREFCVLAAVYSQTRGRKAPRFRRMAQSWIRYLADGYKNRKAFEAAHANATGIDTARLADPPPTNASEAEGFYRYDRAQAFLRLSGLDETATLTGPAGAFAVLPTKAGVLFQLRPEHGKLADLRLGRTDAADYYGEGERVVFTEAHGSGTRLRSAPLRIGTVQSVGYNGLEIESEGTVYTVSRTRGLVTPIELVPELTAEPKGAPAPRWTERTIGRVLEDLHRTECFLRFHDGRSWFYSVKLKPDTLAAAVMESKKRKRRKKQTAEIEALAARVELAEMDAAHEAKKAQLLARMEAARKAAKSATPVGSVSEGGRDVVGSVSAKLEEPYQEEPIIEKSERKKSLTDVAAALRAWDIHPLSEIDSGDGAKAPIGSPTLDVDERAVYGEVFGSPALSAKPPSKPLRANVAEAAKPETEAPSTEASPGQALERFRGAAEQ